MSIPACQIPPDDRLPTFAEIKNFDAAAAWDRLSLDQQRALGILAVRAGTVGLAGDYFCHTFEEAARRCDAAWTPEMIRQMVWPQRHRRVAERLAQESHQAFCDHFDAIWPVLFGWVESAAVKLRLVS